jgi:hypothetical protein
MLLSLSVFLNANRIPLSTSSGVSDNIEQPWWVIFIIIPLLTTIIFPTIKAFIEKDPKAFIDFFTSLFKKMPKTLNSTPIEKPCINCKEQKCRDCDKHGIQCKLSEVLSFHTEKSFTVSIPAYEMPLYNERTIYFCLAKPLRCKH